MSVLKCVLFFVAVSSVFGCDDSVHVDGPIALKSDACGVDDLTAFKCTCPWSECTTTQEEFIEGLAKISAGTSKSFGSCKTTGFTVAFIVISVLVTILLVLVCAWCCCCKGIGCTCTALFAGGCCCDKTERTTYTTVAPAY